LRINYTKGDYEFKYKWRTSDEVAFINTLDGKAIKKYLTGFRSRKFDPTVNRRLVLNLAIKRLKESGGKL